jgi:hypothetical protein
MERIGVMPIPQPIEPQDGVGLHRRGNAPAGAWTSTVAFLQFITL